VAGARPGVSFVAEFTPEPSSEGLTGLLLHPTSAMHRHTSTPHSRYDQYFLMNTK
jgi:hypothetical protein